MRVWRRPERKRDGIKGEEHKVRGNERRRREGWGKGQKKGTKLRPNDLFF